MLANTPGTSDFPKATEYAHSVPDCFYKAFLACVLLDMEDSLFVRIVCSNVCSDLEPSDQADVETTTNQVAIPEWASDGHQPWLGPSGLQGGWRWDWTALWFVSLQIANGALVW